MTITPIPRHVALGEQRFVVNHRFTDLPAEGGRVTSVAAGPCGRVFVLLRYDPGEGESGPAIVVCDAEGRRLDLWDAGGIHDAHMLTVSPDGRIFVVDRDAHQIVVLDASGAVCGRIGERHGPLSPFNHPTDVAIAPDGTILVADGYAASRIHRFAPDLTPLGGFGEQGTTGAAMLAPHAVCCLTDGTIVVADRDTHRVMLFDGEGALRGCLTAFFRPTALWAGADDVIHVTDQVPSLTTVSANGRILGRCRPFANMAHGVCRLADGTILLAEADPRRITAMRPAS